MKTFSTFEQKTLVTRNLVQKGMTYTVFCSKKTVLKFCCPEATQASNGISIG